MVASFSSSSFSQAFSPRGPMGSSASDRAEKERRDWYQSILLNEEYELEGKPLYESPLGILARVKPNGGGQSFLVRFFYSAFERANKKLEKLEEERRHSDFISSEHNYTIGLEGGVEAGHWDRVLLQLGYSEEDGEVSGEKEVRQRISPRVADEPMVLRINSVFHRYFKVGQAREKDPRYKQTLWVIEDATLLRINELKSAPVSGVKLLKSLVDFFIRLAEEHYLICDGPLMRGERMDFSASEERGDIEDTLDLNIGLNGIFLSKEEGKYTFKVGPENLMPIILNRSTYKEHFLRVRDLSYKLCTIEERSSMKMLWDELIEALDDVDEDESRPRFFGKISGDGYIGISQSESARRILEAYNQGDGETDSHIDCDSTPYKKFAKTSMTGSMIIDEEVLEKSKNLAKIYKILMKRLDQIERAAEIRKRTGIASSLSEYADWVAKRNIDSTKAVSSRDFLPSPVQEPKQKSLLSIDPTKKSIGEKCLTACTNILSFGLANNYRLIKNQMEYSEQALRAATYIAKSNPSASAEHKFAQHFVKIAGLQLEVDQKRSSSYVYGMASLALLATAVSCIVAGVFVAELGVMFALVGGAIGGVSSVITTLIALWPQEIGKGQYTLQNEALQLGDKVKKYAQLKLAS